MYIIYVYDVCLHMCFLICVSSFVLAGAGISSTLHHVFDTLDTHKTGAISVSTLHSALIELKNRGFMTHQVMQHTATHCNTLQHTATLCNTLQHTATLCNTLQHTATHCNTLQHTATHCNTLQHSATLCNTLQHSATLCNTLQHTATHCNAHDFRELSILPYVWS